MKLDSKQMHIASQLFMAAGKAGHPFDLARFVKEPIYASETMAKLNLHADTQGNDVLQSLTSMAIAALSSATMPVPLISVSEHPTFTPQSP